jgi:hypothetical protein
MVGRAGVVVHPKSRRAPDLGAGRSPSLLSGGPMLLPSSEHYRRSSREAPPGLLAAPAGPRVSTAPGGEGNGAAAEHEEGDLVLRAFDWPQSPLPPPAEGRSPGEALWRLSIALRCGPETPRQLNRPPLLRRRSSRRTRVGRAWEVSLSLKGRECQAIGRRPKQPQIGQHSRTADLRTARSRASQRRTFSGSGRRGDGWGCVYREGFQNRGSCCGAVVFVDQSAEPVAALDVSAARLRVRACRVGREQRESSVRALAVVVGGVDAEHRPVKLRLRACWVTQKPVGFVVQPARWTRRFSSSMKKST